MGSLFGVFNIDHAPVFCSETLDDVRVKLEPIYIALHGLTLRDQKRCD